MGVTMSHGVAVLVRQLVHTRS
eukprot:COSAG01_NODE_58489_length_305_cov_2.514563_1_plen_21_part_01